MRKTSQNTPTRDASYTSLETLHGGFHAKAVEKSRKPILANEMLKRVFPKL